MDAQLFVDLQAIKLARPEETGEEQINSRQTADAYRWINARNHHCVGRLWASNARS